MPLTINDIKVNKISGPITMHILLPSDYMLKKFKYSPILILFGDKHKSDKGFCEKNQGEKEGHYKVFDVKFLKLLSDAVDGKGIIDFYNEGGDLHYELPENYNPDSEEPIQKLWGLFRDCYSNERMNRVPLEVNKSKCSLIKNIRWQSGDIRFFIHERTKNYLFHKLNFITIDSKSDSEIEEEAKFKSALNLSIYKMREYIKLGIPVMYDAFDKQELSKEISEKKENLICKQLLKITPIGNMALIRNRIERYINMIYNKEEFNFDRYIEFLREIDNTFRDLLKFNIYSDESILLIDKIYKYYKNSHLEYYIKFLLRRASSMVDLYILTRNYKILSMEQTPIEESKSIDKTLISTKSIDKTLISTKSIDKPLISIIYLGDAHIENIYTFLTEITKDNNTLFTTGLLDHEQKLIPPDLQNRCIDLSAEKIDININREIDNLLQRRNNLHK
jgi:hypothetical protein